MTWLMAGGNAAPRLDAVTPRFHVPAAAFAALALLGAAARAAAQDIEPRTYSNAPVGVSFALAGYAGTRGGLAFDPSIPVTEPKLRTSSSVLAYATVFDLAGQSAKFDAVVPYVWLSGSALYAGAPIERVVDGFADPALRLSMNLYGAPALSLKEFGAYEQDLIVGASVRVSVPWGQYDSSRVVNIGMNRWAVKPEIGISRRIGPWTLEAMAAATLYTDNDDFYGGQRRSQDPVYSVQGHATYGLPGGTWVSGGATYFSGGRTTIGGVRGNDLQQNWRFGATLALPVDRLNSVKLHASSGVAARTGNDFDAILLIWQHRWGGGL